ncbi:MAG: S41 family peptidase [Limisphaerales bacterium]
MKHLALLAGWLVLLPAGSVPGAVATPPRFREVFEIVRTNLGGLTPDAVERAALKALLTELGDQVTLTDQKTSPATGPAGPGVSKSAMFDTSYGYIRVSHIGPKLDEALATEFAKLGGSTKLKGLLLDLRYAAGTDQRAAARVADRFLPTERLLLTVDGEALRSTAKTNAVQLPTAILVNRHTSGAAEVLAALLRQNQVGLLIGTATTGGIRQFKEFTLSTGQRLRIATGETKLGEGQSLPASGLRPDIAVTVGTEEERAFYAEPYRSLAKAGNPNAPGKLNEAELVRRLNAGENLDALPAAIPPAVSTPQVRDPALARALDLLKGLAVVRAAKP